MSSESEICQLCQKQKFKYTCPKCNIQYCSVDCYKAPAHLKCSEAFYKECVEEHISCDGVKTKEDMQKMYEILKRIRESDAGIDPKDFDVLDSDDEADDDEIGNEDDTDIDIATRLQGIDINDADEVWKSLTHSEQEEFKKLVDSGDIMKLMPEYLPWWTKQKTSKIVDLSQQNKTNESEIIVPKIFEPIPDFKQICSKAPSLCIHYNIWNILSAYTYTVRFFAGEHLLCPSEAAAHLVNLSQVLKYGTNFEEVDDAIVSVEMEDITSGNSGKLPGTCTEQPLLVESREVLQADARSIMSSTEFKLAALSDILQLLKLAKEDYKSTKAETADFQKLFALCIGSTELNAKKLKLLVKKIEFLLSYVKSENSVE